MNFRKALDKVPHNRLISKFRTHGIGEHLCGWIEDCIPKHQERVVLNGEVYDWQNVTSVVPQGSVLEHTQQGEVGGEEPCSILSLSPTCSLVVVCSPAETLVIDQLVFWYLFFLCNIMQSYVMKDVYEIFVT